MTVLVVLEAVVLVERRHLDQGPDGVLATADRAGSHGAGNRAAGRRDGRHQGPPRPLRPSRAGRASRRG